MTIYPTPIHRLVALAHAGTAPNAIIRLRSGWVFAAEKQVVEGYCLLLADPVVSDLNSLGEGERAQYCLDAIRVGDALLEIQGAQRINYEIWGNLDPALHTHIVPRYSDEPVDKRILPICKGYDPTLARLFDPERDAGFVQRMHKFLSSFQ